MGGNIEEDVVAEEKRVWGGVELWLANHGRKKQRANLPLIVHGRLAA